MIKIRGSVALAPVLVLAFVVSIIVGGLATDKKPFAKPNFHKAKTIDKDVSGNRGYVEHR